MAKEPKWTQQEDNLIILLRNHPNKDYICQQIKNRTWTGINKRIYRLGLQRQVSAVDRFLLQVDKTDACWLWTGRNFKKSGYGRINSQNKCWLVHHFMWVIILKRNIPDNYILRHSCDNRLCVHPEHLLIGTHQDNMNDMKSRNRQYKPCGSKNSQAILDEIKVTNIRCLFNQGKTLKELAKLYHVHKTTIHDIVRFKKWRHIR